MRLSFLIKLAITSIVAVNVFACAEEDPEPPGDSFRSEQAAPDGGSADNSVASSGVLLNEDAADPLGMRCGSRLSPEMPASWTRTGGVPSGFQVATVEGTASLRLELRRFDGTIVSVTEYEYNAETLGEGQPISLEPDDGFLARIQDSGVPFGFVAGDLYAEDASKRVLAVATLPQVMVNVDSDGGTRVATPGEAAIAYAGQHEDYPEFSGTHDAVFAGITDDEENIHIALITRSSGQSAGGQE